MGDLIDLLIATLAPSLALAFLRAFQNARLQIQFNELMSALEAGNIDAAIEALNIDAGDFNGYVMERQNIAIQSGERVAQELTKERAKVMAAQPPKQPPLAVLTPAPSDAPIVFRFDMTNPLAEQKIRTMATEAVTGYTQGQKEIARSVIAEGYARGEGPLTIATEIAGRVDPITNRREGGIVGLSAPQVQYTQNMRRRLLSGDPAEMMKVLGQFKDGKWIEGTGQTLRNRTYDRTILKAIREVAAGKPNPLTPAKIEEMVAKYSDRLLSRRAQDIARTETAQGVELARAEATRQALDKAGLPDDAVEKRWVHQGGIRHARNWHLAMNNATVTGIDTLFVLPDGSRMLYPHDPAGGAHNNINCRCRSDQLISWLHGLI